ncbi:MAG: serine/threonine-protein kinase [Polyangia bacterium]
MADLSNQRGSFSPPRQLEEFLIERPVGRGASGHVYLARDTVLDRAVAIKFLGGRQLGEHARRRFLVEARAIARLKHPSVVTVYRFGEWMGRPYLVSEYVPGQSLARLPKPIPWRRALTIGAELARGLAAAHQEGVLHRDIKPATRRPE